MTNLIETMAQAFRDLQFGSHTGDPNKARARAALAAIEASGYRVVPVEDIDASAAVRWADAVLQRSLIPRAALSPESIVVAKFVKSALSAAPKVTE